MADTNILFFVFQKFNILLKGLGDEKAVTRILQRIDEYLQEEDGQQFLVSDRLARADCYFLPIVQHVRVAGKVGTQFTRCLGR
jgi:chloride intracellular channel protein 2